MAIRHKRKNSTGYTWQASDLVEGQVGLNIADGTLHFKKADNSVVSITEVGSSAIGDLSDTQITTPVVNDLLIYNGTVWANGNPNFLTSSDIGSTVQAYDADLDAWSSVSTSAKQDTLVSGTNIKTVNGNDLLGAGNIVISSGLGLGSITAYKADGSQDNIDITANTTLDQITLTQELLYDASALIAIENSGNYGWRDITSDINVKGTGSNNPTWGLVRDGLYAYQFSASTMQECWLIFHINHDYALGTPIHLHAHWVNSGTNTGTVRFGFEYSIAKGHQQEIFPATSTVYVEQACTGQYYHMIAEIDPGITSTSIEPDSIIMVRLFRDASHVNDTCTDSISIITTDIHYQANRFATLNKAPNFNA